MIAILHYNPSLQYARQDLFVEKRGNQGQRKRCWIRLLRLVKKGIDCDSDSEVNNSDSVNSVPEKLTFSTVSSHPNFPLLVRLYPTYIYKSGRCIHIYPGRK